MAGKKQEIHRVGALQKGGAGRRGQVLRQLGKGLQVRAKAWITSHDETFLAYGRVVLLERIQQLGSISAAARSIGMSYRRAWWHTETMNRLSERPLVETAVGGKRGGGAKLTPEGKAAVHLYWFLDQRTRAFQEEVMRELCSAGL